MFNHLYKYFELSGTFDPFQFGFRPKHSTIDAVTLLTNDIPQSLNKKDNTIVVFCDLS